MKLTTLVKKPKALKTICLITLLNLSVYGQTYSWVKHYQSPSHLMGQMIACSPSGDNYATASFLDTVIIGGKQFDEATSGQLIMKHDGAGTLKWVLPMQGVSITGLKATETHVYMSGYYHTAANYVATEIFSYPGTGIQSFIIRMTEHGVIDLVVHLTSPGPDARIFDMDVDETGRMYITGIAPAGAVLAGQPLNNTGRPTFIARIDQDGSIGWVTTANSVTGLNITTSQKASRIFVSARVDDGTVVTFDGSTYTYTHNAVSYPPDYGGYYMLACDNTGKVLDAKMLASSAFRIAYPQLELSEYNDLYVVMAQEYNNVHMIKFDTLMNKVWEKFDPSKDASAGIAVDVSGNLLMAGTVQGGAVFSGTELGGTGLSGYVAKYDNQGKLVWVTGALNTSSSGGAHVSSVDSDNHTDVYITGMFEVPTLFPGYGTLQPTVYEEHDMFIARIRGMSDYESVSEHQSGRLRLYPTVNDGGFIVDLKTSRVAHCAIFDISGRCMFETELSGAESRKEVKSKLSDGVYFVRVRQSDGYESQSKIVVKN